MGRFLSESGYRPGLVVSSDATRARETARLAREEGGWSCETVVDGRLYRGGLDGLLGVVRDRREENEVVLLVGHNPTMAAAVSFLSGGGTFRFPTAAIACIEIPRETATVGPGCGVLRWLVVPRLLGR
jgi:phosphohistidine phosphatase